MRFEPPERFIGLASRVGEVRERELRLVRIGECAFSPLAGDDGGFMNKVALRAAPQREKPARKKAEDEVKPASPTVKEEAPASPFAKLKGLFSG